MIKLNAMEVTYEPVSVFDKPALFTELRIDRDTVPDGLHTYDIRHDDYGEAATIEKSVGVNYLGTVIMADILDFGDSDYLPLDQEEGDLNFAAEHESETVAEFQRYIAECQQAQDDEPEMTQEMD